MNFHQIEEGIEIWLLKFCISFPNDMLHKLVLQSTLSWTYRCGMRRLHRCHRRVFSQIISFLTPAWHDQVVVRRDLSSEAVPDAATDLIIATPTAEAQQQFQHLSEAS